MLNDRGTHVVASLLICRANEAILWRVVISCFNKTTLYRLYVVMYIIYGRKLLDLKEVALTGGI